MSASSPLGVTPRARGYELRVPPLAVQEERTSSRRARLAVAGLLISGTVIAAAAAHTAPMLPQPIQPVPASLAGVFGGLGLNIHAGGAIAALAVFFGCYAAVVKLSDQLSARLVLTAIAGLLTVVVLAPPLFSTDVFSYEAYARMGALYGINPYTHGPYGIFFDQSIFPYIGAKWWNIASVYGPVFTVFSYVMASMSVAASVFAYKGLAALATVAVVVLVWRCARLRGTDPVRAAALVALNPLLVIYGVGGGHNDLLMLVVLTAGLYAVLASRERLGGGLAMMAAGIKMTAGIILPFALAAGGPGRRRSRRDLILGAAVAAAMVASLSFVFFGTGSLEMIKTINRSQSEGDWQTLPGFLSTALHLWTVARIVGYSLAAAFCGVSVWLVHRVWHGTMDWIDAAGWATLTMLIASSSLLPWYVGWLLPLAAVGHDRRLTRWTLIFTGVVQAFQLVGYIPHASGIV